MVLKGFLLAVLALCAASHVAALTLASSKWIWKDSGFKTVAPFVSANFRRQLTSPSGKEAVAAKILIAGDSSYKLFVNGQLIGNGNNWKFSQQYCVGLNPTDNLFAVSDEHLPPKPGDPATKDAAFIATIQVFYDDGTSHTIVTDKSWLALFPPPPAPTWKPAFVAGSATSPPWSVLPTSPPGPSSLSLCSSSWIWTNEVPPKSPTSFAPTGARAFRKKFNVPAGATVSGVIIIAADDKYNLFINGSPIISGGGLTPQKHGFSFTLSSTTSVVTIAVEATNLGGQAGLIAAIALNINGNPTSQFHNTDGTWKFHHTVPPNFQKPNFNDASWPFVVVEGPYGVQPWGAV